LAASISSGLRSLTVFTLAAPDAVMHRHIAAAVGKRAGRVMLEVSLLIAFGDPPP
jgi:hypothetical protein